MKCVVIYKSTYGYTRKYAEWIASELSCDLLESKQVTKHTFSAYDVILLGGGIYAGGMNGMKLLKKNFKEISTSAKTIIIFTCSLADPDDPENVLQLEAGLIRTVKPEILRPVKQFHFRGGINYKKLSKLHAFAMAMVNKILSRKDPLSLREEDLEMLESYGKSVDYTDKNAIQPLIEYVKSL